MKSWEKLGLVTPWPFIPYKVQNNTLQSSPDKTLRYVGLPTMNGITHALASDLPIHFETEICSIQRDSKNWTLIASSGKRHSDFNWLIICIPAEQAKPLINNSSELYDQIPDAVHTPCWTVALSTTGHVEKDIQGIFGDDTISWVSRQSAKPGQKATMGCDDLWIIHFSPEYSQCINKNEKNAIHNAGLEWLNSRLNVNLNAVNHFLHYWRYANITDIKFPSPYLVDKSQKLAINGAWCCGGRVEGAYLSAVNLLQNHFSME